MAGFTNPAAAAETYKLDPAHTSVVFRIKHLGVAYVYGRFNGPTGAFVFDESSPSKNSIQMQVDAQNVDTAVQKRDNHLKSPDFFNAGEHPLITFKSTSVKKSGKDSYEITGNLTLLGKTKPITVEDGSDTLLVGTKPQFTYPALSSEAQGGGFLNLTVDPDGVTDAQNTAGETFTKKQLIKIAENSSRTAQDLIRKIKSRIDEHILGADQFDYITIVALRRKG